MGGAFLLVALQVVAMGNFNGNNSPRSEVYGWEPIGTFSTADACVKASAQLARDSTQVAKDTGERKSNGTLLFRCLPT